MATILVDGKPTEVGDKPLTLLCHKGDVHLMPDGQVEIGPEQTLARANRVSKEEWAALQADTTFVELMELVLGRIFPLYPDLKCAGTGVRHMTGMLLLFRELQPGQKPFLRYPESFLHPSSQTRLPELLIRVFGIGKPPAADK